MRTAKRTVTTMRALAGLVAAGLTLGAVITGAARPAEAAPPLWIEEVLPLAGPRGPVAIVGDSVMLGSVWHTQGYGPSLGDLLLADGWGPITSKAGAGLQTGRFLPGHPGNMTLWLQNLRRVGWDAPTFVVNLGANEVTTCRRDVTCAVTNIDLFLDAIGPGHRVWWAKITMPDPADAATWNAALDIVAARRPELTLWDWPAAIAAHGVPMSGDNVHLPTAAAYRQRSRLIADDLLARRNTSMPFGPAAATPTANGGAVPYEPLAPHRVIDTRLTAGRVAAGGILTVDLSAEVAADATAVSVNIAVDAPATAGFLTAWPCDAGLPVTSSLNFVANAPRSAHALVALDDARRLCIFASTATEVIVDLQGAFGPSAAARFDAVPPDRLADTRRDGRRPVVQVTAPPGAAAIALNITATGSAVPGFLTAFPCGGTMPTVASVNFGAGETVGGAAFVPVAADETVCIFSNTPVDVIVDLTGTFSPGGSLRFVPGIPTRMLDTRNGRGGWTGALGPGQSVPIPSAPAPAAAVSGTLTIVDPALDAHLTAYPCASGLPPTASVNAARAGIVANSVTVGIDGGMCIAAAVESHVVYDTTGWWTA